MTRFEHTLLTLVAPHWRAERLLDAQLDAERGLDAPPDYAQAWLHEHLEGCARCRQVAEGRSDLMHMLREAPSLRAPEGFAARTLAAARAEGRARAPEPRRPLFAQWLMAGLAVAVLATFAVVVGPSPKEAAGPVEVSGTSASLVAEPDFMVRAPSMGAAEIRATVSRIAAAHGAQLTAADGVLWVRIPREALVAVLQDLSRAGEVKVTPKGTLDPERVDVLLRVNLD